MKKYKLLSITIITSLLLLISCKKSIEVVPAATATVSKLEYKLDEASAFESYPVTNASTDVSLPQDVIAEITFTVNASAGITQISSKDLATAALTFPGFHLGFGTWGNERIMNKGFDSPTKHSFVIPITKITDKTVITIQVHTEDGLQTAFNFTVNPIDLSDFDKGVISGLELHSQLHATDSIRYATSTGVHRETKIPSDENLINFVFADSTGASLVSPNTDSDLKTITLPTATSFKESSLDITKVMPMDLVTVKSDDTFKSILKVEAGKTYVFITTNVKGLIKVNSLTDDGNGNDNAVLNYDVISIEETK